MCVCFGAFRWVKFEEKVEEGGERWSKPHVSTLSLHSLFELRTCLQTGIVLLDLEGYSLPQIVGKLLTVLCQMFYQFTNLVQCTAILSSYSGGHTNMDFVLKHLSK